MKKTMVKVFAFVMCLCMIGSAFVGCGKKGEYFVIGATGPLTGDASSYGQSVREGALVAIDEINAAGGLNGIQFKLEMMDDQALADKVTTAYDSLLAAGMHASIGSVTTGSCLQFAELSKKDNVFFITPSASAAEVIKESNGYRVCFGDPDQGTISAEQLSSYNKVGVIYNTSDSYSNGIYAAFSEKMTELGKTFVTTSFTDESKTTFATQVTKLKNEGCDVVFLPIYYQEAWLILQEIDTQGYQPEVFGCDGMDGLVKHVAESPKKDLINGVRYITPFDASSSDAKVSAFVTAYKAKWDGKTPDQFAADGYDAVMVIYEAMKKAGVSDTSISASDLCAKLQTVLNGEFTYVGATGSMTWDASGAPNKKPQIVVLGK